MRGDGERSAGVKVNRSSTLSYGRQYQDTYFERERGGTFGLRGPGWVGADANMFATGRGLLGSAPTKEYCAGVGTWSSASEIGEAVKISSVYRAFSGSSNGFLERGSGRPDGPVIDLPYQYC